MNIKEEIIEYHKENHTQKIANVNDFKNWLEIRHQKRMPRPLFVSVGKGGGQTYKTLWEVFDVRGNAGRLCYFFNENEKTIHILENTHHLPLQHWLDNLSTMPDL